MEPDAEEATEDEPHDGPARGAQETQSIVEAISIHQGSCSRTVSRSRIDSCYDVFRMIANALLARNTCVESGSECCLISPFLMSTASCGRQGASSWTGAHADRVTGIRARAIRAEPGAEGTRGVGKLLLAVVISDAVAAARAEHARCTAHLSDSIAEALADRAPGAARMKGRTNRGAGIGISRARALTDHAYAE